LRLVIEQGTQIQGRKMPEVENFQKGSSSGMRWRTAANAVAKFRV
jgi:hypothetical protein